MIVDVYFSFRGEALDSYIRGVDNDSEKDDNEICGDNGIVKVLYH